MFVQSDTNIDWKLVSWHLLTRIHQDTLRIFIQMKRTIADCPEVLEVFSVETLKEKASMQMESRLLCLVVYWLFHRIWQDSRTQQDPFCTRNSCGFTKSPTWSRSGFWKLKWALMMICQRSSQHIPRSDRHLFYMSTCSAHMLKRFETSSLRWPKFCDRIPGWSVVAPL